MEHNYPHGKAKEAACVSVDINAVLESVTPEELRVGAWVNVLGYVRDARYRGVETGASRSSSRAVYVEAILVFSAGAVNLGEYERIVREGLNVDRRIRGLV